MQVLPICLKATVTRKLMAFFQHSPLHTCTPDNRNFFSIFFPNETEYRSNFSPQCENQYKVSFPMNIYRLLCHTLDLGRRMYNLLQGYFSSYNWENHMTKPTRWYHSDRQLTKIRLINPINRLSFSKFRFINSKIRHRSNFRVNKSKFRDILQISNKKKICTWP